MAAFECAEAGVSVVQVTKGRATSGTITVARGGFAAAMGKDDSPELHLRDILKHGGELVDPELTRVWVYDIVDVVRDLESWGADVRPRRGRCARPQDVSEPFPGSSGSPLRHHGQHADQGVVEKAARRRPHRQALDHGDRRSDHPRRPGRRRLGRRLRERHARRLRCATDHPLHRWRERAVLRQRQPAAGDRGRVRAGLSRRCAAHRHRDDRLPGDVLLATRVVRVRAAPHRLHQRRSGLPQSRGRGIPETLLPCHRRSLDSLRGDPRHGTGNPRRTRHARRAAFSWTPQRCRSTSFRK